MADNQIVTEIIIDADQAELSLAQLAAAQRAAQREFDKTTAKIMENTAATQRAAEAGIDVADSLTITAGALRKARTDSDAYLGRMDPLIFAHTSLTRELGKVGQAIKGVDTLLIAKKIHDDEAIARVAQLEMREKELAAVMAQLEAGTMDAAEAMVFMKTATERLESSIKPVITNIDALRAKLVPLEAAQKAWAVSVAEINTALAENNITLAEAALARERLIKTTDMSVRGMTEEEAAMAAHVAMLQKLIAGQTAYNQLRTGVSVNPFAQSSSASINAGPTISNPLYGADREKRQRELEQTFAQLDQLEAKYNPLTAALQKYNIAVAEVISDHAKLGSSAAVVEAELAKVAAAYYANVKAINDLGTAHTDLDALRASIDPLYAATQKYNKEIDRLLAAEKLLPGSSDIVTAAIRRTTAAYDAEVEAIKKRDGTGTSASGPTPEELNAQRAGFDQLFAAGEKYRAKLAQIADWEKNTADGGAVATAGRVAALAVYEKEADAIIGVGKGHADLTKKMNDGTASAGQMRFATQQLTVQMSQMFSGIATGQPVMITMIQQLHQVFDVAVSSGTLKKSIEFLTSSTSLMVIGFVAATAAIVAFGVAAESANARLGKLEQSLSGIRPDFKEMAKEADEAAKILARTTSLSTEDSRTASNALAKAMDFKGNRNDIVILGQDIEKLSIALGEDIPAASKRFVDSMTSPSKAAEALIGRLQGFDSELVRNIQLLESEGRINEAFTMYLNRQRDALQNTRKATTEASEAIERLGKAFTVTGQDGQNFLQRLGQPFVTTFTGITNLIAGVMEKLRELGEQYPRTMIAVGQAASYIPLVGPLAAAAVDAATGAGSRPQQASDVAGMVVITAPGGASFTVKKELAPAFQFIIDQLERRGYAIDPNDVSSYRPGAVVEGTGKMSMHSPGAAIDINASRNRQDTRGDMPDFIRELVKVFPGMKTGLDFSRIDPMHVGFDGADLAKIIPLIENYRIAVENANKAVANTPARAAEVLKAGLAGINAQLKLDPTNEAYLQYQEDLIKRYYEAVPATQALVRSIRETVDANISAKDAALAGVDASIIQENRNKAMAEAIRLVGKDSEKLIPLQTALAAEYDAITTSVERKTAAEAQGTPEKTTQALERQLRVTKDLLAQDPGNTALQQRATQLTKDIYNSIPAFDAHIRQIKEETDAANRMGLAWAHGSEAAAIQANREKALARVRQEYGPETAQRIAAEAQLNKLYDAQLETARKLEAEEAKNTPARRAEEIATKLRYAQDAAKANPASAALAQQAAQLTKELYDSVPAIDLQVRAIKEDTAANDALAKSWLNGAESAYHAEIANKALAEANKHYKEGSDQAITATALLTVEMEKQAAAAARVTLNKANAVTRDDIALVQLQTRTLGMNADARELVVQGLKNEQAAKQAAPGADKADHDNRVRLLNDLALQNQQLKNTEASVSALGTAFSQAFDTIGNAITQALINGQGAAVNWKNVMVATAQQVLQAFAKLAFVGPFLNYLGIGPTQPTLDLALSGLFGGGGAAGGGTVTDDTSGRSTSGIGGSLSSIGTSGAGFLADALGLKTGIGGTINSAFGGPGTSLFAIQSGGSLWATPASGAGSIFGSGSLTAAGPGVTTLGGAAAGIGGGLVGGFLAGSLAGGAIQGSRGTTGPAPYIGAGLGALAGTVGGFLIGGPVGAVIGGIGGGLVGGGAGGFIGPKKASAYSSTLLGITDGHVSASNTLGQGVNTAAEHEAIIQDVNKLNDYLDSTNLKLTSLGEIAQLGSNTPGKIPDPSKFANIAAGFDQLRFSSPDPNLNKYLQGRGFADSAVLEKAISDYHVLVDTTIPTLMAFGKTTGTVTDSVKQLNDAFNAAVAGSNEFGLATEDLTRAQADAEKKIRDAANAQINDFDTTLRIRKMVAQGADPQTIELTGFDQGAAQQRESFKKQMVGLFGDAFTSSQYYADQMALLEETLGAERAAIVKKYADIIIAQEKQLRQIDENLTVRLSNATPGDAQGKELFAFDVKSKQEKEAFSDQLIGIYGTAFTTTQAYADQINLLERVQGAERLQIVKKYADALVEAERGLARGDQALKVRLMNATPGVADLDKKLFAFDVNAQNEREDFSRNLLNIYGDAYATTAAYANRVALLEQVLGAERLQIVTESNDAIVQKTKDAQANAANAIQSLVQYATGLQTSDASPLSPQDKLTLSRDRFNAVSGAAAAGDYNSIQQLSGYADTFLSASREVYGSGAAYVGDFQRVLDVLGQVADVAPDTLTASVLATETRTQTAELVQELQNLKAAVDTVTTQLRQNQTAPARIAA